MKKINWKKHFQTRLKITGFIFALVGWFLLVTVSLEKIFQQDLSTLEDFVETRAFKWGIKIVVVALLIILIKGQSGIDKFFKEHKTLRILLRIVFIGGLLGWIVGLGSLIV